MRPTPKKKGRRKEIGREGSTPFSCVGEMNLYQMHTKKYKISTRSVLINKEKVGRVNLYHNNNGRKIHQDRWTEHYTAKILIMSFPPVMTKKQPNYMIPFAIALTCKVKEN